MPYILHRGFAPVQRNHGGSARSRQIGRLLNYVSDVHSVPGVMLSEIRSLGPHVMALKTSTPAIHKLVRGLGLNRGLRWAQRGGLERLHIDQKIRECGWPTV